MIRERVARLEAVETAMERDYRFWEVLPGAVSWLVMLAPVWLTSLAPTLGLGLVLLATVYFAIRASLYGPRALLNRGRILEASTQDWLGRLEALDLEEGRTWSNSLDWRSIRVTLMIRAYRERNLDMLRATLESIAASNWLRDDEGKLRNLEVLFATEEDDPITPPLVDRLTWEFAGRLVVRQIRHPEEPGKLPGPSTAMNYVGSLLYDEALRLGIHPRHWIVADFDADTLFHQEYVACLVHEYVSDPQRDLRAYQPVVMFTTDYWKAPLHSRLSAIGTSVLTLGWNRKPEIAFTGAAASLATLHSVGFWPTNSHSQDSGIQLRLRMRYGRRFRVKGLPIPLWVYPVMPMGMQSTLSEKLRAYWQSYRALFRQSARWREGPLDEFVEASSRGHALLALDRLWNGLERDTLTVMPGLGLLISTWIVGPGAMAVVADSLKSAVTVGLTAVSILGLLVFWKVLGTTELIPGDGKRGRRIRELVLFWVVFSIYVPIFTSLAGIKTSTAYLLGKRPRGHFMPTPK